MRKILMVAAIATCALPRLAYAEKIVKDLKAADGTVLKATYFSPGKHGPGIVLLHMCNSQRSAWDQLGEQLAARGFHAIALDYRGFGESGGENPNNLPANERQRIYQELWSGDIDAAFNFLVAQPGVDKTRIGAAGGSCGVNNAIQLARRHPEVKTLVLLAGATNADGEQFLAQSPWMPIFASASNDDGNAVETMRWTVGFSGGSANQFKEYATGGHGTEMFAVHKDLEPAIVNWFDQHLVKSPVTAAASAAAKPGPSARQAQTLREPGGGAKVLAEWQASTKAGKPIPLAPEAAVNAIGYEFLQGNRVADATSLFALNVAAHPDSANTYDSLSDAYLAAGNKAKALEFAKKALEVLPRDTTAPDGFKQQIKDSAEAKIKQLGSSLF
jgi:dienelactone hydrolase